MSEEAFHIMTQMDLEGAETQAVSSAHRSLRGSKCPTSSMSGKGSRGRWLSRFEQRGLQPDPL